MRYCNGKKIMIGDHVSIGGGMDGIVVCCFDEKKFMPGFVAEDWGNYTEGVMIDSLQGGLIYYQHQNFDIVLLERSGENRSQ